MTWFEELTGLRGESRELVHQNLTVDGNRLRSLANGQSWIWGELQFARLSDLRQQARSLNRPAARISVSEVVADVQRLHRDKTNAGAMFQVASQFNLLEMVSPRVTPESGVGIYEHDFTQGPACAIAAGAGTIYRNYFVPLDGQRGQTGVKQVDCLADLGQLAGNSGERLWSMRNGYALASESGLREISQKLSVTTDDERDRWRQALRIGLHWNTQVTLEGATHLVSQAYCSALPVAYSGHSARLWADFATLILEAAYEATLCAAAINASRTGIRRLYLTLLGGGAFGNDLRWILHAIDRAVRLYRNLDLDVAIVSYGSSNSKVRDLIRQLNCD